MEMIGSLFVQLWALIGLVLPFSSGLFCDYYQEMELNKNYFIYNSEYPNNFKPGSECRWIAHSPPNSNIVLSCSEINIPISTNCAREALTVSVTGDPTLLDGQNYCGTGTLHIVSESNSMSIGQYASPTARGGKFYCTITAIGGPGSTEPPPPRCDCGYRQETRIVGGKETGVNEFTYMSAIVDLSLGTVRCGASIISDRYAVTAAHCVDDILPNNFNLLVGDHDISTGQDTSAARLIAIERFIVNENFIKSTFVNDVALVKTATLIVFSIKIGPVCLPFKYQQTNIDKRSTTILGWGTTEFSGPTSDVLLAANVSVVSNIQCADQYKPLQIQSTQLCAYGVGKDSCQYDSGGPLILNDQQVRRDFLMGIISYGMACGSKLPGIYTRVTSYLDWIRTKTPEVKYCQK